ncbi:MAG: hypothetical protein WBC63_04520 [Candidatus Bipolaricaulia bacterium]
MTKYLIQRLWSKEVLLADDRQPLKVSGTSNIFRGHSGGIHQAAVDRYVTIRIANDQAQRAIDSGLALPDSESAHPIEHEPPSKG